MSSPIADIDILTLILKHGAYYTYRRRRNMAIIFMSSVFSVRDKKLRRSPQDKLRDRIIKEINS